jgi:hypothetical protein
VLAHNKYRYTLEIEKKLGDVAYDGLNILTSGGPTRTKKKRKKKV